MNYLIVTLTILFIILLVFVLYIVKNRTIVVQKSDKIAICQVNSSFDIDQCDNITKPFKDIIDSNEVTFTSNFKDANLILFTDYSLIDQNFNKLPFKRDKLYYVYGISGSDEMANKASLALNMRMSNYEQYIPKTYVLYNSQDMRSFGKESSSNNIYILKKNIQRQEGNLITSDIKYIKEKAFNDGYVVCQELLQDPYLVNGRKINIRIYLLVLMTKDRNEFYIYNNGFMYYTPNKFVPNTKEAEYNITTGYIDRRVYDENPLTLQDFHQYLGKDDASLLSKNMITTFSALKESYQDVLGRKNNKENILNFNIFGVDIAPNEKLDTIIIEINKGPDLSYKDERDKAVKLSMVRDVLALVNLNKVGNPTNFIKI